MQAILDSAAVIAFLNREIGHDLITDALAAGAGVCTANIAEAIALLVRRGLSSADAVAAVAELPIAVFDVDLELAQTAGTMAQPTSQFGLSLGDRLCLALAARERLPALTADRIWAKAGPAVGVEVRLIR